jgi:hypothetical protein
MFSHGLVGRRVAGYAGFVTIVIIDAFVLVNIQSRVEIGETLWYSVYNQVFSQGESN